VAALLHPLSDSRRCHARRATALAALAALLTLAWAAAPAQASTQTFTYTGAEQTFKVPGGVTSIGVVAIGGAGGDATDSVGGAAAEVTGNITVTPGATLYVEVGGLGEDIGEGGAGGFNGGGNGGGGGGGASDVRTAPGSTSLSVEDTRLIVAAGGGGGGGSGPSGTGANGGAAGEAGSNSEIYAGGGAGTSGSGGAGAEGCLANMAGNGTLGEGGAGGNAGVLSGPGGGGGGGFYGGGGGAGSCELGSSGGGGGSSLVPPLGLQLLASSSAAPKIELTYTLVPPTIEIGSPANGTTYQQGEVVKAAYSCTPPEGTAVEACEGPVANGAAIDTSTLGPHAFKVEAEDKDTAAANQEVTYTVVAPPSISITSPANGTTYTQGQAVTAIYSCAPAGGTGVKTCTGPVANGGALDTSVLGSHSFEVKAEDLDGGKATQSVSYTVAPVACPLGGAAQSNNLCPPGPPHSPALPNTTLGSHPKKTIRTDKQKVKVKFTFSSSATGATFKCKLDKGAFAPCTSPKTYKVKLGKHAFLVEAVNAAGADPTPASFSFKVVKKH
jgi:Glycine rich protein